MIKNYNIVVNGESYEVSVEEIGVSAPSPRAVQASTPQAPRPVQAPAPKPASPVASGSDTVVAPMPGTIIDVKKKEGDSVKQGDVLCILEAMKMENEIMAGADGVVASVKVSKGSSVSSGDVLVTLK